MSTGPSAASVFGAALEITSAAERAAYLDRACGADTPLRARVEQLLEALARAAHAGPE
jgi:hypothetical protein